ncbi:hypothetical protein CDEF62S_01536 [Castellaniella defragrans]
MIFLQVQLVPGTAHLAAGRLARYPNLVILGDHTVAPTDADVHDPKAWEGSVLVSEPEREAFRGLLDLGLQDPFRMFEQAPKSFSWWDYRQMGFRRNPGVRIDHILASPAVANPARDTRSTRRRAAGRSRRITRRCWPASSQADRTPATRWPHTGPYAGRYAEPTPGSTAGAPTRL